MRIAFASCRYFPFGGLEKDMLRTALCARDRGHDCTIFTGSWEGERPEGINVRVLPLSGFSNHIRTKHFAEESLRLIRREKFDVFAAFNRIPGCDFYFCADDCQKLTMSEKHSFFILNLLPRYRTFLKLEKTLFAPDSPSFFWNITEQQKEQYMQNYGSRADHFILLPPGMNPDCRRPANAEEIRLKIRKELGIPENTLLFLTVGSNPFLKGFDRVIRSCAALPDELKNRIMLCFAGSGKTDKYSAMAEKTGLGTITRFLGPRKDIPELLFASDALFLPSRHDATGTVLVEGISAGVPVLCSSDCGFSPYVQQAGGFVIPSPWHDEQMTEKIICLIRNAAELRSKAIRYSATVDFTRRADAAVDSMEHFKHQNNMEK